MASFNGSISVNKIFFVGFLQFFFGFFKSSRFFGSPCISAQRLSEQTAQLSDACKQPRLMTELTAVCATLESGQLIESRLVSQGHGKAPVGTAAVGCMTDRSEADARPWLTQFCARRPGIKQPAPHAPNAEIKNEWSYTFAPHTPHCAVIN
jgi:hypothetical protein